MKKLVLCMSILLISGCAPFNVQISLFQSNDYILGDETVSSNKVLSVSKEEPTTKSYGNGNKVIIHQMNNLYKSPTTNSSNKLDVAFPLMGGM